MARRKNPKDSACPHCGKYFTKGGLKQHMRFVKCSPKSTASPRKFERVRCRHCGKSFHSTNSLRVHVSTCHPKEYIKSPGSMKNHRSPYKRKCGEDEPHVSSPAQHSSEAKQDLPAKRHSTAEGSPSWQESLDREMSKTALALGAKCSPSRTHTR